MTAKFASAVKIDADLQAIIAATLIGAFLIFGAALLPEAVAHLSPRIFLYAVLSLTVIRMLPIALSLLGTGLRSPSILFLGWFGPRGLASIIFVGVLVDAVGLEGSHLIVSAVIVTVTFSVLLHGVTAPWGANKYADWADGQSEPAGREESAG